MKRYEQWLLGLMMAVLGAGAGLVWWISLQPLLVADPSPIDALPTQIGGWKSLGELPIEEAAEAVLDADHHLLRVYWSPAGGQIALYIGYYGTAQGGRPEHTPDICYPSSGWTISSTNIIPIDPGRGLRANELDTERDGERQLVLYYFRSERSTGLLTTLDQTFDRFTRQLGDGRGDGALIRVSTPANGPLDVTARGRLVAFASELDPILDAHWPSETVATP